MGKGMDGVDKLFLMELIIKDGGKMMSAMVKVLLYKQMVENIKGSLKTINVMAKVNIFQRINNIFMKVFMKMIFKMGMVYK
jgi:hypothetical protein